MLNIIDDLRIFVTFNNVLRWKHFNVFEYRCKIKCVSGLCGVVKIDFVVEYGMV